MTPSDGGRAFPVGPRNDQNGMVLRDYVAIRLLAAQVVAHGHETLTFDMPAKMVKIALAFADEYIAQRDGKETT